jgi:hypothetical protein
MTQVMVAARTCGGELCDGAHTRELLEVRHVDAPLDEDLARAWNTGTERAYLPRQSAPP